VNRAPTGPGGEYYLTDAFQYMIDKGAKIKAVEVDGWYDAGKPETLLETNLHVLSTSRGRSPAAQEGVVVHEPVHVADGVELEDVEIGPNVTVSSGSKLRSVRIRDSIVGAGATIEQSDLHDSLIGDATVVRGVTGKLDIGDHSVVESASR
jgi:glucose-1-phosphate thymidylyltransferase